MRGVWVGDVALEMCARGIVAHRMYTDWTRTILFAVSGAGVVPWRMVAEPCDISVAWRRPKAYLFRLTSLWL